MVDTPGRDAQASQGPGPTVGKVFSHYQILEKLGEGGMGAVYLAHDQPLDRRVALKFLSKHLQDDPVARRRFVNEAKAAAALDHPYICHIHEVGEVEGQPFIAMEYVGGASLAQRLAGNPLPVKDVVRIASEIAEALETAHQHGIVHRDLKPANIMLTAGGHVKVVDFGLARKVAAPRSNEEETISRLTLDGAVYGTVAYMSPEQIRGREVDVRSDIFSFGLVLYEMVTGRHPFRTTAPLETSAAILTESSPPLERAGQAVPALLEHIVRKMLAKEPEARYQLVHDVRTDLLSIRDGSGRAPLAQRPFPRQLVPRLAGRAAPWARAAAVVAFVLLTAVTAWWVVTTIVSSPGSDRLAIAVLPLTNISFDPVESDYLADGITKAVITRLAQVNSRVTPWETAQRFRDSQQLTPNEIAQELHAQAVLTGTFQLVDDRILVTLSLLEADTGLWLWRDAFEEPFEDVFEVQRRIAQGVAVSLGRDLSADEEELLARPESTSIEAYDLYLQGADYLLYGDAESTELASEFFSQAIKLDPDLVEAHIGLGAVHNSKFLNAWGGGMDNLDKAAASYDEALRLDLASTRARRGLIKVHWERGNTQQVLQQGQEAARRVGSADDIETLLAMWP